MQCRWEWRYSGKSEATAWLVGSQFLLTITWWVIITGLQDRCYLLLYKCRNSDRPRVTWGPSTPAYWYSDSQKVVLVSYWPHATSIAEYSKEWARSGPGFIPVHRELLPCLPTLPSEAFGDHGGVLCRQVLGPQSVKQRGTLGRQQSQTQFKTPAANMGYLLVCITESWWPVLLLTIWQASMSQALHITSSSWRLQLRDMGAISNILERSLWKISIGLTSSWGA